MERGSTLGRNVLEDEIPVELRGSPYPLGSERELVLFPESEESVAKSFREEEPSVLPGTVVELLLPPRRCRQESFCTWSLGRTCP